MQACIASKSSTVALRMHTMASVDFDRLFFPFFFFFGGGCVFGGLGLRFRRFGFRGEREKSASQAPMNIGDIVPSIGPPIGLFTFCKYAL